MLLDICGLGARKLLPMKDILLVEDDVDQADVLRYSLQKCGYSVIIAYTGKDALTQVEKKDLSLIILDVVLPDITGFDLLSKVRQRTHIPILLVSASMCSEENRVTGLSLGAQDYLSKSCSHRELLCRVKNLLAPQVQNGHDESHCYMIGERKVCIDLENQTVEWGSIKIQLTPVEFKLLVQLLKNRGKPVSYGDLSKYIWDSPVTMDSSSIKVHITRLRAKIEKLSQRQGVIRAIRGQGYVFIG